MDRETIYNVFNNFLNKIVEEKINNGEISEKTKNSIILFNEFLQKPENKNKIIQFEDGGVGSYLSNYSNIFNIGFENDDLDCFLKQNKDLHFNKEIHFKQRFQKIRCDYFPYFEVFFTKEENLELFKEIINIFDNY